MSVQFRLTIQTEEASVYFETMPPMPVPRVGEIIHVPGDAHGWWQVEEVTWMIPSMSAMEPTMEALVTVSWAQDNRRPAPTYDDDRGWVQAPPPHNP